MMGYQRKAWWIFLRNAACPLPFNFSPHYPVTESGGRSTGKCDSRVEGGSGAREVYSTALMQNLYGEGRMLLPVHPRLSSARLTLVQFSRTSAHS